MIDVLALRTLVVLDSVGSVTATAEALGYTSAAISHQLQKLSRYIGAPVTERTGRGIALTPMGRELSRRGTQLLQDLESLETDARARSGEPRGRITVGGFSTGIRGVLVPSLPRLKTTAPELSITNIEEEPDELIDMVTAGRIDASLIFDWRESLPLVPSTLNSELIAVDRADIVMHRDHHLASRSKVTRRDLLDEVFVSAPRNGVCHRWLTALFDPLNAEPRIEYWAMEYDTQIEFARAVGALALVPRLGRPHLPEDVAVVELDDPSIARWIYLVWRSSMSASPAIALLLKEMRSVVEEAPDSAGSAPGGAGSR
ncbi:DNA-binding transcriptional regulator, LysR family [Brevibacterium sp. 239c]|uniref:LysR family transcriptional regulator n=1 Tax=Brevibacterium sp. 239c TaxID=1965356 RepID=UPI000C44146C|nr:LysR family transcriptional regulator [Brevibacterium sp. 239c]SMX97851.1 DNA-binding transcriptional regulator, LysR family [Brevibacterium sp. 239c]